MHNNPRRRIEVILTPGHPANIGGTGQIARVKGWCDTAPDSRSKTLATFLISDICVVNTHHRAAGYARNFLHPRGMIKYATAVCARIENNFVYSLDVALISISNIGVGISRPHKWSIMNSSFEKTHR